MLVTVSHFKRSLLGKRKVGLITKAPKAYWTRVGVASTGDKHASLPQSVIFFNLPGTKKVPESFQFQFSAKNDHFDQNDETDGFRE